MIHIIDTYSKINTLYANGIFDFTKWEAYMNSIYKDSADMIKRDMQECLDGVEYTYEESVLPVLQAVYEHPFLERLHSSFLEVTDNLNERIQECFGHELNIDIVLYLGLCNAAGWVTNVGGTDTILLGVEKILELGWQDVDSMHRLREKYEFEQMINMKVDEVYEEYLAFAEVNGKYGGRKEEIKLPPYALRREF